jgi:hypothetical protein
MSRYKSNIAWAGQKVQRWLAGIGISIMHCDYIH